MSGQQALNGDEGGEFAPGSTDERVARIRTAIAVIAATVHPLYVMRGMPLAWREHKQDGVLEVQVWQVASSGKKPSPRSFGHRGLRSRIQSEETFGQTRERLYAALLFDVQIWVSEVLLVADENGILERNGTRIVREWVERTPFRDVLKAAVAGSLWRRHLSRRRPSIRPKP